MPSPEQKRIAAFETVTLIGQVVGEVRGGRSLPRPSVVAAVFVFFGLLSIAAETGGQAARIASAIAAVVGLGAIVGGAAGKTIIDLLNRTTAFLPRSSSSSSSAASSATSSAASSASSGAAAAGAAAGRVFTQGQGAAPPRSPRPRP
jgi:hypothetical protein